MEAIKSKLWQPYPKPTRSEVRSCCVKCRRQVVQAVDSTNVTVLMEETHKGMVLEFDETTGVVSTRRKAIFTLHSCSQSDINFHHVYLIEKKYRLEREKNPDYRAGDKIPAMNFIDDEVLGTLNYDCPQCERKEGEPCRSMVNYKDGRVLDNKNCHKIRRTLALRMQGLGIRYDNSERVYRLFSLPTITRKADDGSN